MVKLWVDSLENMSADVTVPWMVELKVELLDLPKVV